MSGHATQPAEPMGTQGCDHVTNIARDEPTTAKNIQTDVNLEEEAHLDELEIQPHTKVGC